jgi:hypothetical protein
MMEVKEDEVYTGQEEVLLKQMNDWRWLRSAGGQLALNLALAWSFRSRILTRRIGYVIPPPLNCDPTTNRQRRRDKRSVDARSSTHASSKTCPNSQPRP